MNEQANGERDADARGERESESEAGRLERIARGIRSVREGHGANCSSIGSVVDTLFAGAIVGGVLFAAVAAALAREKTVRVVGASGARAREKEPTADDADEAGR